VQVPLYLTKSSLLRLLNIYCDFPPHMAGISKYALGVLWPGSFPLQVTVVPSEFTYDCTESVYISY
jgi:hypothetical protein